MTGKKNENKNLKKTSRKEKDSNGPKKNMSAYMIFCRDTRTEIKNDIPDIDNKSILVELGKRWKKVKESDPDKLNYYNDLAEKDKKRYQEEKANYVKSTDEEDEAAVEEVVEKKETTQKKKTKTEKVETEGAEPKKTKVNGYINYCTSNRERCKKENEGQLPKVVTKILSEEWKALSDKEKEKYKY